MKLKMVGLSVVLESQKGGSSSSSSINNNKKTPQPQVINKTTMNMMMLSTSSSSINQQLSPSSHHSPPYFQPSTFLDQCFLCNKRLLPGKDIYMYKGDRAFCSVDCRCKQILTDEEEAIQKENRSLDACHHQRKGARNKPGGVVY